KFSLAPQASKWLVKSSPQYIGNFLAYIELLQVHWMHLEETIKGKPPKTYVETFTKNEWHTYTMGMMDLARLIMPHLLPKLHIPSGAKSLLDVAGSHGLYSIELCRRYPQLEATIADFPEVLGTTRTIVADNRLQN